MESDLSGIFRVKPVTKNIVLVCPGTHFMHMSVNNELFKFSTLAFISQYGDTS